MVVNNEISNEISYLEIHATVNEHVTILLCNAMSFKLLKVSDIIIVINRMS